MIIKKLQPDEKEWFDAKIKVMDAGRKKYESYVCKKI